ELRHGGRGVLRFQISLLIHMVTVSDPTSFCGLAAFYSVDSAGFVPGGFAVIDLEPRTRICAVATNSRGRVVRIRSFVFGLLACTGLIHPAAAVSLAVEHGEYKLAASFDSEVTTELQTEEWAHVWRPVPDGGYPLVLFLHGNHGTCGHYDQVHDVRIDDDLTYTFTGTCPNGYVVAPSHRGYDYLANDLASHGYVVVSINANRGVNGADGDWDDPGLNLRRGRLVLRHMEYLSQWNTAGGAPDSLGFQLTGILDFGHLGLMGHSRGGEGMRAAVAQYQDTGSPWPARIGPVTFEALFEIGPVDGQTSRILNNTGMQWNVLLPG